MPAKNGTEPRSDNRNRRRGKLRARLLVWFCALVVSSILAVIAYFVSWAASLAILTGITMFAVIHVSRRASKEREATEGRLAALAGDREIVIDVLFGALGLRDMNITQPEMVANLAGIVAWQMGLREDDVRRVKEAALLHDVGKMGIADSILSKPGALSEEERAVMRRHSEVGFALVNQVPSLQDAASIIRCHHERFDGQGYPQGLKGDDIPIGARIFAVVDAYVAMTSERPYRKKLPHELVVKEIVRNSLTQFDPEVVAAFLQAERQGLLSSRAHAKEGTIASAVSSEV